MIPPAAVKIRERVTVRRHPTVVRLVDDAAEAWISDAYMLTAEARVHLDALRAALSGPTGIGAFLIGQYGAGKSHFLAYLTRLLERGDLVEPAPDVVTLSLVDHPASVTLERVVASAVGATDTALAALERGDADRRAVWGERLEAYPRGLLLLVDELSEFLRSKATPAAFNEDIRFLQFLGEIARDRRLFVVAAMQEAIEHTGEMDYGHFRKIKDRYALRMRLTPAHVRELVADAILDKAPGYDQAVGDLVARLREAFPDAPVDWGALASVYPIHPATLELLEEVRDRFSQTRGVVDFVTRRLAGDPAHGVEPFLDAEWGGLLTPDAVVDHFEDVLEVQAEFLPLAQHVLPWARRHLADLFENDTQRALASRVVRLLILAWLAPARDGLSAEEAATWLLFAANRVDPARNLTVVRRVLDALVTRGRYVRAVGDRYVLDLDDDGTEQLDRMVGEALAALSAPEVAFEMMAEALAPADGFWPFALPADTWQARECLWHFHARPWAVWLGNGAPPPPRAAVALVIRLPWGAADAVAGCASLLPRPLEPSPALRELAALLRLRDRPLSPEARRRLEARITDRAVVFRVQAREAYAQGKLVSADGRVEPSRDLDPRVTLDRWLDDHARWMLRRRFSAFERFAPTHGPLPRDVLRLFARVALTGDMLAEEVEPAVTVVREGYLAPADLLQREGRRYRVKKRLDRHDLVAALLPLVAHAPPPQRVYDHLAAPVFGLVPDQVDALLVLLVALGEVDVLKSGRSYRELFETMPSPRQYERVTVARGLSAAELRALEQLCRGLGATVPSQWTVGTQRGAIRTVRDRLRAATAPLLELADRLGVDSALAARLRAFAAPVELVGEGGVAQWAPFVEAVGSVPALLSRLEELRALPARIDRQLADVQRLRHVFSQPGLREEAEALGEPPEPDDGDALDRWLRRALEAQRAQREAYAESHAAWWADVAAHPGWRWRAPAVASCRDAGAAEEATRLATRMVEAERRRCRALSDLTFQTRCTCGFDGQTAPAAEVLADCVALRATVERRLRAFFDDDRVRRRVAELDMPGLGPYVAGEAPWPDIDDVASLDQHLAGVEAVRTLEFAPLEARLAAQVWTPDALVAEVRAHVGDAERVRFVEGGRASDGEVAAWCHRQALRTGTPLPRGLGPGLATVGAGDVSPSALRRLRALGLPDSMLDQVLERVVDGAVEAPADADDLVRAAAEVAGPSRPTDPEGLATLSARLYAAHPVLSRVAGARWLRRLEALADTPLDPPPTGLPEPDDVSWLVVDALGLPLLPAFREALPELLPAWRLERTSFATVGTVTTTAAFYEQLGGERPLHKVDAVDRLLHERVLRFDDLVRLALAELRPELRRLAPGGERLLVLADHGFRLDAEGRRFTHGGASTLERTVPLLWLRRR